MSQQWRSYNFKPCATLCIVFFFVLAVLAASVEAKQNIEQTTDDLKPGLNQMDNFIASTNSTISVVVDGMILNLRPSHFQRVKIRLMSMGPGGCVTRVIIAGDYRELPAPPLVWSNWYEIGPAFSGGAHALTFQPLCDTGALGEVMYDAE
jgi:hypothetical protein